MKKIFLALIALTLSTVVFAESKGESPSNTDSKAKLSTYWITGTSGSNYVLSNTPNPACGEAEESPCEITSQNPISTGLAPMSQVDGQTNGFKIIDRQHQL